MDHHVIVSFFPLTSAVIFLAFAIAVFLSNTRKSIKSIFICLALATFWWQMSWFFLFNVNGQGFGDAIAKIGYFGILFLPVWLYHLCLVFTRESHKTSLVILKLAYALTILFEIILIFSPFLISGTHSYSWGMYPQAGILHPLFILFVVIMMLLTVQVLRKAFLASTLKNQKDQLTTLIKAIVCYNVAAVDFITNYGFAVYPFGFIFIILFIYYIWEATTKNYLLHVPKIFVQIFSGLAVFIYCWLLMSLLVFSNFMDSYEHSVLISTALLMLCTFLGLSFYEGIRSVFENILDQYDNPKRLTLTMYESLHEVTNKEELLDVANQIIKLVFAADFIYFLKGQDEPIIGDLSSHSNPLDVAKLGEIHSESLYDEKEIVTPEKLQFELLPQGDREKCLHHLDEARVSLIAPLKSETETVGWLILGKKPYAQTYTSNEIEFINRLTPVIARRYSELS